jgi:hypothetical protein
MEKDIERMFTRLIEIHKATATATISDEKNSEQVFPNRSRFELPAPALTTALGHIPFASKLAARQPRLLAPGPTSGIHCIVRQGHGHEIFFLQGSLNQETGEPPRYLTVYRVRDGSAVKQIPHPWWEHPNALWTSVTLFPGHELAWFYTFRRDNDCLILEVCGYNTQRWEKQFAFSTRLSGPMAKKDKEPYLQTCRLAVSQDGARMAMGFDSHVLVWTQDEKGSWARAQGPLIIDTKTLSVDKLHFSSRPGEHHLLFVSGKRYAK